MGTFTAFIVAMSSRIISSILTAKTWPFFALTINTPSIGIDLTTRVNSSRVLTGVPLILSITRPGYMDLVREALVSGRICTTTKYLLYLFSPLAYSLRSPSRSIIFIVRGTITIPPTISYDTGS